MYLIPTLIVIVELLAAVVIFYFAYVSAMRTIGIIKKLPDSSVDSIYIETVALTLQNHYATVTSAPFYFWDVGVPFAIALFTWFNPFSPASLLLTTAAFALGLVSIGLIFTFKRYSKKYSVAAARQVAARKATT